MKEKTVLTLTNKYKSCIMLTKVNKKNKGRKNGIKSIRRVFKNNVCIKKAK